MPEFDIFFGQNTNISKLTSGKIQVLERPLRAKYNFLREKFGQKNELFFGQNTTLSDFFSGQITNLKNFEDRKGVDFGQNTIGGQNSKSGS